MGERIFRQLRIWIIRTRPGSGIGLAAMFAKGPMVPTIKLGAR